MSRATFWKPGAHRDVALRPERHRLATCGESVLSDRELLAMLVGTGATPGCDVHTLVERLLARFGSMTAIARAHPADLAAVAGLGPAAAARLSAAFELGRRGTAGPPPQVITKPYDVARVVRPMLAGRTRERAVVVVCNRVNRVLGCEVVSEGSADSTLLPAREVMVAVLRRDGQAFALAHNHPSGDPTPSGDDIDRTAELRVAACAVGLRFLGHVVVAEAEWRMVGVGAAPMMGQTATVTGRTTRRTSTRVEP